MLISIISPVHNEALSLPDLVEKTVSAMGKIAGEWEMILVDDGSTDQSWECMQALQKSYSNVNPLKLPENIGQYQAIKEGILVAQGEWVVVMDSDGQDNPLEIPNLYKKALEGFDLVFALRMNKEYGGLKIFFSRLFHKILSLRTGSAQDPRIAGFGIYKKKILLREALKSGGIFYLPAKMHWKKYNTSSHEVTHLARKSGVTKYSFLKQAQLAWAILARKD